MRETDKGLKAIADRILGEHVDTAAITDHVVESITLLAALGVERGTFPAAASTAADIVETLHAQPAVLAIIRRVLEDTSAIRAPILPLYAEALRVAAQAHRDHDAAKAVP